MESPPNGAPNACRVG